MDPSGIIGIIGVAGHVITTCAKLSLKWRDAPDDAKKLKSEAESFQKTLLETYNHLIRNPDFYSAFEGEHSVVLSGLATPSNSDDSLLLFTCKQELEDVLQGLQKRLDGSRFGRERLKATLFGERTESAIENLQRRCQVINNMISIDNARLAANTNIEVRSTRKHLEEKHLDEKKQKILDWITPIDFAAQQIDNLERRQEGTGQWLLESQEFQTWIEEDRKTLFCPGMPGAGKTMLSSIVIEHLQDRFGQDPTVGIAYVFCNFRRHDQQKPRDLLASILKQLYWAIPTGLNDVEQAYERHGSPKDHTPMSMPEIIACLRSVMSCFDKVYILADALDEFRGDEGYRDQLLKIVLGLSKTANVNIFATSRHIPEIESHFEDAPSVEIRATDEDVTEFLDGHMYKLPQAVRKSSQLQSEVKHSIVQAVQGMFLLAQLYLDSLQGKRSAKSIKEALSKFSSGHTAYDIAYEEAMERIEGQLEEQRTLAKDALSWIVCATRPLKTWELQHALAVEIGTAELDEDNITDLEDIVSVCAGLITIDEESEVIRLVHYTTQEFFERTSERWLPNAQELIVESCVTYLSFDALSCDTGDSDSELDATWCGISNHASRVGGNPLFEYAAFEWGKHAQNISPPSERLLSFLMGRKANLDAAADAVADVIRSFAEDYLYERDLTGVSGLHLAAFFGLREVFTIILERSGLEADINIQDSKELTPLSYAVMGGRVDFIEWLLSEDEIEVEPERFQYGFPPVTIAVLTGEVARILPFIESDKANLDAADEYWDTPLMHAIMGDHADIFKALVDSDRVDIELQNRIGETALMLAAGMGHVEMVKYLLGGANANPNVVDNWGNTPLHHALMGGYLLKVKTENLQYQAKKQEPIVSCLLDSGQVDVSLSAENKKGTTPLEIALKYFGRDHPITKLLVDRMEVIGISTGATIKAWEDVQKFPYVSIDDSDMMWLHKY